MKATWTLSINNRWEMSPSWLGKCLIRVFKPSKDLVNQLLFSNKNQGESSKSYVCGYDNFEMGNLTQSRWSREELVNDFREKV